MGSRRRPLSRQTYAEQYGPGSSSREQGTFLDLLPPVKRSNARSIYTTRNTQQLPWSQPVHPVLTDYGSETLRAFLHSQLERLDSIAYDIKKFRDSQLREWAQALVSAPEDVVVIEENDKLLLKQPLDHTLSKTEHEAIPESSKDKGKALAAIRGVNRTSKGKAVRIPQNDGAMRSHTGVFHPQVETASLTPKTASLKLLGFESEDQLSGGKKLPRSPRRSSRLQLPSAFRGPADDTTNEDTTPQVTLSRASSFENHVSHSRDSSRADRNTPPNPGLSPNDLRRRRKTPALSRETLQRDLLCEPIPQDSVSVNEVTEAEAQRDYDLPRQKAIFPLPRSNASSLPDRLYSISEKDLLPFDYSLIVPESFSTSHRQASINRCIVWKAHGLDVRGKRTEPEALSPRAYIFEDMQLDPDRGNILGAPNECGDYPREYKPSSLRQASHQQPRCSKRTFRSSLPIEIWDADTGNSPGGVLQYLSSAEVRNLRLVCKALADDLGSYMFRSVVTKFGPSLFSLRPTYDDYGRTELDESRSMILKHGSEMNKFGISFDCDLAGLINAPSKITETTVDAWFGQYSWPTKDYPYFQKFLDLDKLLDDERRILTQVMKSLTECRELALSIDSGHGWLEGPDLSDLATYRLKTHGGSKVFGKAFRAEDKAYEDGIRELFRWAQLNTINENTKYFDTSFKQVRDEVERLHSITTRDYDSYRQVHKQPDYEPHLHTGGIGSGENRVQPQAPINQAIPVLAMHSATNNPFHAFHGTLQGRRNAAHIRSRLSPQTRQQRLEAVLNIVTENQASQSSSHDPAEAIEPIQPQWPLVFNGYNIAAESMGNSNYIQARVAKPNQHPVVPNCLTEAQAQWIMETSWVQRTFLSAYADAVQMNTHTFRNVHSLHLAKISSGLLPMLSQKSFWTCLSSLRRIIILVKPDWRVEHIPGDKFFQSNMPTNPVNAAYKFHDLLKNCIAPLENLNSLQIGYTGGGEHQSGIFGRNQHILPAPITLDPRAWLVAQNRSNARPNLNSLLVFPHVRTLTFENCWFNPLMLENFLLKSRDTSLHNLILDSVSLSVGVHSGRTDGPLRTVEHNLCCQHGPSAWLNESLPPNAAWATLLDGATSGKTMLDHKYDANMIDEEKEPRPEPAFRGNIQQITLRSCGYVKILGIPSNELNQNELVFQNATWSAMDEGLKTRACQFTNNDHQHDIGQGMNDDEAEAVREYQEQHHVSAAEAKKALMPSSTRLAMLSGRSAHIKNETLFTNDDIAAQIAPLTGFLTQCIHPIEKRILERMWGLRFGWGDDMRRWDAVEDGWFMGGTGRFSGEIYKDFDLQEAARLAVEDDAELATGANSGKAASCADASGDRGGERVATDDSASEENETGESITTQSESPSFHDEESDTDLEANYDISDIPPLPPHPVPISRATLNDTNDESETEF